MRVFQNSGVYPTYRRLFDKRQGKPSSFAARRDAFLADRFGAVHLLKPVLDGAGTAFFTNGDDDILQKAWARENGIPDATPLDAILLSQIEHHRTEVFYNLDPMRYGSSFVRRLPGSVKHAIAWRAAPSLNADFEAYDRIVCNFPSILAEYEKKGWKGSYFAPAHDPEMDSYAANTNRPVDIIFVGGYSRHHKRRAAILEAAAALEARYDIRFHLDTSRLTRLADTPAGLLPQLAPHRRPAAIRKVTAEPIFGRDLYRALSEAKIVLNCAVDMAGEDRGNMRCFEAMGCGCALVSDVGRYPDGMVPGVTLLTYDMPEEVPSVLEAALDTADRTRELAGTAHDTIRTVYSKDRQWQAFLELIDGL